MEILVKFDTKAKTCEVTMGGKKLDNVLDICVYKSYSDDEKFYLAVTQGAEDKDESMQVMTRTAASTEALEAIKAGIASEPVDDCVTFKVAAAKSGLEKDVLAYFGKE